MKINPNSKQLQFRKGLEEAIGKHGAELDAVELLAITSHFLGQLIALQDQRKYNSEQVLEIVQKNIQQGNIEAINSLLNGGNNNISH